MAFDQANAPLRASQPAHKKDTQTKESCTIATCHGKLHIEKTSPPHQKLQSRCQHAIDQTRFKASCIEEACKEAFHQEPASLIPLQPWPRSSFPIFPRPRNLTLSGFSTCLTSASTSMSAHFAETTGCCGGSGVRWCCCCEAIKSVRSPLLWTSVNFLLKRVAIE